MSEQLTNTLLRYFCTNLQVFMEYRISTLYSNLKFTLKQNPFWGISSSAQNGLKKKKKEEKTTAAFC